MNLWKTYQNNIEKNVMIFIFLRKFLPWFLPSLCFTHFHHPSPNLTSKLIN